MGGEEVYWSLKMFDLGIFLKEAVGPEVLRIRDRGNLGTEEKGGFTDIKTEADTRSEVLIKNYLCDHFPGHAIRGEEGTSERGDGEFEWIVDPIDGTMIFASGMPQFGISVGLAQNGVPVAGVIHYPELRNTAWAIRGNGAFVNGKRIVPFPFFGMQNEKVIAADLVSGTWSLFSAFREHFASVLFLGAHVYTALLVAGGKLKAYVSTGATPFDMCAAIVLVRESGGVAVGVESDTIDLSKERSRVIYARTHDLVQEIREVIGQAVVEEGGH